MVMYAMNVAVRDIEMRKVTNRNKNGSKSITLPRDFAEGIDEVFVIRVNEDCLLISRKMLEMNIDSILFGE